MTSRPSLRASFLASAGWGDAKIDDLAGDASNRRYFRLWREEDRAVLMDAPPEKGEDVRPFVKIARTLRDIPLSAPEMVAEDHENGFLLLEDLGDDLFARVVKADPSREEELYAAATDALIALHQKGHPADLDAYDPNFMADLAALAFDWYATGATGQDFSELRAEFCSLFAERLSDLEGLTEVLIQRDYHAENLLWLPTRNGAERVGLLDFQDAMSGHRAYDLVSLLQDARRDVSPGIEVQMINHYLSATKLDPTRFKTAYTLLGLQRNLRIIGVFARLCLRDAKPHYIDMIPRVWAHMVRDLQEANFGDLETVLLTNLPNPTTRTCEILRAKCGTIRAL